MPKLEPIPSSPSHKGGRRARGPRVSSSLAEINVVPLVDVMLVLLVIFMVAAPMMTQGFPVNLPQSRRSSPIEAPITVTIPSTFRRDQRVMLGEESVPLSTLDERIRQLVAAREQKSVTMAADGDVPWSDVVAVWDQLRAGGVYNVGAQTQPPSGR
jgi:biopolymer transport protein ExbD